MAPDRVCNPPALFCNFSGVWRTRFLGAVEPQTCLSSSSPSSLRMPRGEQKPSMPDSVSACPSGWTPPPARANFSACYSLLARGAWRRCPSICASIANASLACIESAAENEFLSGLVGKRGLRAAWVGHFREGGGRGHCVSGDEDVYANWLMPSDADGQGCARLPSPLFAVDSNASWFSHSCHSPLFCMCELRRRAPFASAASEEYVAFAAKLEQGAQRLEGRWTLVMYGVIVAALSCILLAIAYCNVWSAPSTRSRRGHAAVSSTTLRGHGAAASSSMRVRLFAGPPSSPSPNRHHHRDPRLPPAALPTPLQRHDLLLVNIDAALQASRRLRLRVRGMVILIGWAIACVAMGNGLFRYLSDVTHMEGNPFFYLSPMPWGVAVLLLAIHPTDKLLIQVVSGLAALVLAAIACVLASYGLSLASTFQREARFAAHKVHEPGVIAPGFSSIVLMFSLTIPPALGATTLVVQGCRAGRAVHSRQRLLRLWLVVRLVFCGLGVELAVADAYTFLRTWSRYGATSASEDHGLMLSLLVVSATFTRSTRGTMIHLLSSLSRSATKEQEAATLAGVLSASDATDTVVRGRELFRALPASTVVSEHFDPTDRSSRQLALLSQTSPANMGSVHAFISHSYHDDGGSKATLVREWAAEKGEPSQVLVWLDSLCLACPAPDAQSNAIGLLPMFIAGCQELLILPGETYKSRIWCLLEVFVFVQIGGEADDIVVRPLIVPNGVGPHLSRQSIDVAKAECTESFDRETILAVIETSFGSLGPFNRKMQKLFDRLLERTQPERKQPGSPLLADPVHPRPQAALPPAGEQGGFTPPAGEQGGSQLGAQLGSQRHISPCFHACPASYELTPI